MSVPGTLRRNQVICFSLVWVSYCSTYFLRKPLGVVKTDIARDLALSKTALGWCDTALVLPYAAVQILLPSLSDMWGARAVLSTCLGLAGVTTYLTFTMWSTSYYTLCLGLALTGGLLAPCWPACTASLSSWFPDNRLNSMFGLINTATYSGGLGGTALAAALLEWKGWKSVALPPAVMAVCTATLVSLALRSPAEKGVLVPGKTTQTPQEKIASLSESQSLLSLAKIPCVPQLATSLFCLKFVRYCMAMWLPLYLLEHLSYSKLQAGMFSTVFDIGGIVGSPLLGYLLDRHYPTTPILGVTLTMLAGTTATAIFVVTAEWGFFFNAVCLLVAGAANCGPDSILAGSVSMEVGERGGKRRGAGVTSFINGVGNIGGMVEGPLIGWLWGVVGWGGILPVLVGVSAVGTVATYKAYKIDQQCRAAVTLPT